MGYKFFYTISIPSMDCLRSDLPVEIGGVLTQKFTITRGSLSTFLQPLRLDKSDGNKYWY